MTAYLVFITCSYSRLLITTFFGFFSGRNCNSSQQRAKRIRCTTYQWAQKKKEKAAYLPNYFFWRFLRSSVQMIFKIFVWAFELLMQRNGQKRHNKKSKQTASVLELAVAAQLMSLATGLRTLNPAATTK
jgi:hypothetical protein